MHPVGPVKSHIKVSEGGDASVFKHYCTTNQNTYGSSWQHFTPRIGVHSGAGYVPNNRGQIFYTSHLDDIDNPVMGRIIKGNYKSICHKHFTDFQTPSGRESLPFSTLYKPSGFIRDKGTHIPSQRELQKQFINGLLDKSPTNILPKHKPYLSKTYPKDPIETENSCHGPKYMSTEYSVKYTGTQSSDNGPGRVGYREMSGFTENYKTEEPTEGRPDVCLCNREYLGPPHMNSRPIGSTIYHTDFWPLQTPTGREPLPNIDTRAAVDNGYTKGNRPIPEFVELHSKRVYDKASDMTTSKLESLKRNDPAEFANASYCNKAPSMMNVAYQGKQIDPFEGKSFRTGVGTNEYTGYISNEDCFVQRKDNVERFVTHNMTKFYDPTLFGSERNGNVNGNVNDLKADGFSRGVKIHQIECQPDALYNCSKFTPYQARSIIMRESITTSPTKVLTQAF